MAMWISNGVKSIGVGGKDGPIDSLPTVNTRSKQPALTSRAATDFTLHDGHGMGQPCLISALLKVREGTCHIW